MQKLKQRSGELFVKNMFIFNFFYMVIIKNYKVKKLFNKFPEISRKIGINFRKFSKGKFSELNPNNNTNIQAPSRCSQPLTVIGC